MGVAETYYFDVLRPMIGWTLGENLFLFSHLSLIWMFWLLTLSDLNMFTIKRKINHHSCKIARVKELSDWFLLLFMRKFICFNDLIAIWMLLFVKSWCLKLMTLEGNGSHLSSNKRAWESNFLFYLYWALFPI